MCESKLCKQGASCAMDRCAGMRAVRTVCERYAKGMRNVCERCANGVRAVRMRAKGIRAECDPCKGLLYACVLPCWNRANDWLLCERDVPDASCQLPPAICHPLPVTCHWPPATCHLSPVCKRCANSGQLCDTSAAGMNVCDMCDKVVQAKCDWCHLLQCAGLRKCSN